MAVETNFVLELALDQEQAGAANAMLDRAERGDIELAIPFFSLAEPFSTIGKRDRDRKRLSRTLEAQAEDLRRSTRHQEDSSDVQRTATMLDQIGRQEMDHLVAVVERLLKVAAVIQVEVALFQRAMQYRTTFALSEQDAIIYAAIASHLAASSNIGPHYFVSKNSKDFRKPGIEQELSQFDCTFVSDFDLIADDLGRNRRTIE